MLMNTYTMQIHQSMETLLYAFSIATLSYSGATMKAASASDHTMHRVLILTKN